VGHFALPLDVLILPSKLNDVSGKPQCGEEFFAMFECSCALQDKKTLCISDCLHNERNDEANEIFGK